jgi:hypothetical protein
MLERAVRDAAAVYVTAEVEAEHCEPLRAGLPAEGVVPGSAAAGTVADNESWEGKPWGRSGRYRVAARSRSGANHGVPAERRAMVAERIAKGSEKGGLIVIRL